MSGRYVLIGQTPIEEPDLFTWAFWIESASRRVALTRVLDTVEVSTVFLGIDMGFHSEEPILFESMAFWDGDGPEEQERCATWSEAEMMHRDMIREVMRPGAWLYYVRRRLRRALEEAKGDFRRMIKEGT